MNEENNQATALAQTSKERLESYLKPMSLAEAEQVMAWADSYSRLPKLLDIYPKMERADWLTLFGREWSGFDNAGQMIADGELQDCYHLDGADGLNRPGNRGGRLV